MCPMCEDKGWPLGRTTIETKYRQLLNHKPTVCAAVNRIMKNLIHRSSSSNSSVDIPKARTSATAELSRSRSVQPSCQCAQARERVRSARGSLLVPVSSELDTVAAEFSRSRSVQNACQSAQARERGPSARRSLSVPASGELDPVAAEFSRSRTFQPACRCVQARERRRSARGSLSVPASGEMDRTGDPLHRTRRDFVLSPGEHRRERQPKQESRMRLNVATEVNLERRRIRSSALQSRRHNRRPASESHLPAHLQRRRIPASASTSQTIDTTCETCGAEVHIPVLTYKELQRDEKFSSSSSRQECNPLVDSGVGPSTDSRSSLSLESFEFPTTSISRRSSDSNTTSNPQGSLIRSAVSISETVLSTSSEYEDASDLTTLSRTTSSLSSLGDWIAQEFRYLCSRQAELDNAKTSLAQDLTSTSEALLVSDKSSSSSSSPEWISEHDPTDKFRNITTQFGPESSFSPPRSMNLFSSSFQKSSGGQETDKKATAAKTTTTTKCLKQKSQESAGVVTAAPANCKNMKKPEQVSPSPSLSPNVVVLLRKYSNRNDLQRIAANDSLHQLRDLQKQQQQQGSKTGSQMQNRRRRAWATDSNASSNMYKTSEWAPSAQQAIASFQEEVTQMLLKSRGDEDDVSELEAIEDFLNGYMRLNTPFYLEMVEEFFRAICLDCFHKPLLTSCSQLRTSC